ncbi:MAG: hypothetical protein NTX86_03905 [Candidatus Dependentiae bacterium]|nr:hypothetical protein [Candidatus Dependentiae bacterium]
MKNRISKIVLIVLMSASIVAPADACCLCKNVQKIATKHPFITGIVTAAGAACVYSWLAKKYAAYQARNEARFREEMQKMLDDYSEKNRNRNVMSLTESVKRLMYNAEQQKTMRDAEQARQQESERQIIECMKKMREDDARRKEFMEERMRKAKAEQERLQEAERKRQEAEQERLLEDERKQQEDKQRIIEAKKKEQKKKARRNKILLKQMSEAALAKRQERNAAGFMDAIGEVSEHSDIE